MTHDFVSAFMEHFGQMLGTAFFGLFSVVAIKLYGLCAAYIKKVELLAEPMQKILAGDSSPLATSQDRMNLRELMYAQHEAFFKEIHEVRENITLLHSLAMTIGKRTDRIEGDITKLQSRVAVLENIVLPHQK